MQVLADENLLAIVMGNVDDPKTMYNLVLAIPPAKATFESHPRQLLTAALSSLPSEINLLALLFVALKHEHVTQASTIALLLGYLRRDDTSGLVEPPGMAIDLAIPRNMRHPFEMLRKLAVVWSAVEDLASGFIERSIQFIQKHQAVEQPAPYPVYYERGHKLRPLNHLWNKEIQLGGVLGHHKPQPWSLPLKISEIHRVKRALWRLEIFALVSDDRFAFPNEDAMISGAASTHHADPVGTLPIPPYDGQGTRILISSLDGYERAELDSVYAYLHGLILKAYCLKLDQYVPECGENTDQAHAEVEGRTIRLGAEEWEEEHEEVQAMLRRQLHAESIRDERDGYLKYLMSLGLPFVHRVHRQITRDNGQVLPEKYPPLQHRSWGGLSDTWFGLSRFRPRNIWRSYNEKLMFAISNYSVIERSAVRPAPMDSPEASTSASCAMYLQSQDSNTFCISDLWEAGCYMWEREEKE